MTLVTEHLGSFHSSAINSPPTGPQSPYATSEVRSVQIKNLPPSYTTCSLRDICVRTKFRSWLFSAGRYSHEFGRECYVFALFALQSFFLSTHVFALTLYSIALKIRSAFGLSSSSVWNNGSLITTVLCRFLILKCYSVAYRYLTLMRVLPLNI